MCLHVIPELMLTSAGMLFIYFYSLYVIKLEVCLREFYHLCSTGSFWTLWTTVSGFTEKYPQMRRNLHPHIKDKVSIRQQRT